MPLQDATGNKPNQTRESVADAPPSKSDISSLLERAAQKAPYTQDWRWKRSDGESRFTLAVKYKDGSDGDATWWFSIGDDSGNAVIWIIVTENLDEIYEQMLRSSAMILQSTNTLSSATAENEANISRAPKAVKVLEANEEFAGRYRIVSQIGHGGMGRIYQVADLQNNRVIALKILHPHLIDDEDSVKRFEREAKAAMHLRHPNLLTVYDYGISEEGLPFIAMEYLNGEVLQKLLNMDGPLDIKRFLTIFLQTCSALHHAHSNSVIHRDVKPSNIMLIKVDEQSDLAKLVDFGIAKIIRPDGQSAEKLTHTGDVFGSPHYMSPEQCLGSELDMRSDIYSLGCVMYEAISGRRPFEGQNALGTMQMQVSNQAKKFSDFCAHLSVPPQIESVIQRAMEKSPEKRYQSAKELGIELERLLTVDQINLENQWTSNQTHSGTFYAQQPVKGVQERADLSKVLKLLKECDLINGNELRTAEHLLKSSAPEVSKYLVSSAQISEATLHAAVQCQKMLERDECKLEMAVIALHYCHRNGVSLRESFDQLGWRMAPGT